MSDWGFDLTRLVRTAHAERYWFVGDECLAAVSETRPPRTVLPLRYRRGCHGVRYENPSRGGS